MSAEGKMNEVERKELLEFMNHDCNKYPWYRRLLRRKQDKSVTVEETPPNGIGPVFKATCTCGKSVTIADVSQW